MDDRLTGFQEQVYECQECKALMNETSIKGIRQLDGGYILPCVVCGSENIKLYQEGK
jgi:hypothetical protein